MSYSFTDAQKARISTAVSSAEAGGSWASAYDVVATIIATEPDASGTQPVSTDPQVQASRLWLLGAAQANAGEGMFSTLIRDYTAREYELHFGTALSEAQAQAASDAVAKNVLGDITSTGVLPTVDRIARRDAAAVGKTLFNTTPGGQSYSDTAGNPQINAAWSGTVLFSFFDHGSVAADQTGRLVQTGASDTRLDSVNDLRDVLYAYDAFTHAAGLAGLAGSYVTDQLSEPERLAQLDALITGTRDPNDGDIFAALQRFGSLDNISGADFLSPGDLLTHVTAGSAAGDAIAWVHQLGPERLLDALDAVVGDGASAGGSDTAGSFGDRAHALFSRLKDQGELELKVRRMDRIAGGDTSHPGEPLSVDALVEAAHAQTPTGKATLFALREGNPFVVLGRDDAETQSLYQRFDHDGLLNADHYSAQYLHDRATYLSQLYVEGTGGSDAGVNDAWFLDQDSNTHVGADTPLVQRRVFGGAGDDSVNGARVGSTDDRLYGGRGDDVLRGFAGDDRLEGQSGDDDLFGGAGHDTYVFRPGTGSDRIDDSDGDGEIHVGDRTLQGSDRQATLSDRGAQWQGDDGTTYTLVDGNLTDGGTLEITKGGLKDTDRIVVDDFHNGDLGGEWRVANESRFASPIPV